MVEEKYGNPDRRGEILDFRGHGQSILEFLRASRGGVNIHIF